MTPLEVALYGACGFLLAACAFDEPRSCQSLTFRTRADLPDAWLPYLEGAARDWQTHLGASLTLRVERGGEGPCSVEVVPCEGSRADVFHVEGRSFDGVMCLEAPGSPEAMRFIAAHEFGHSLGLGHETDASQKSVMWPYVRDPFYITPKNVEQLCTIWGCSPPLR